MTGLFRGGEKGFAAAPQNLSPINPANVVIASAAKQSVAGCAVLSQRRLCSPATDGAWQSVASCAVLSSIIIIHPSRAKNYPVGVTLL